MFSFEREGAFFSDLYFFIRILIFLIEFLIKCSFNLGILNCIRIEFLL